MTHEELRDLAVGIMAHAIHDSAYVDDAAFRKYQHMAMRALNALGGAEFHVLGPEVSGNMIGAGQSAEEDGLDLGRIFKAMVAIGDLTRKPDDVR